MPIKVVCAGGHLISALGTEAAVRRCAGIAIASTTHCPETLSKLAYDCDVIVSDLQSVSSWQNADGEPLLTRIRAGHINVGLVLHSCIKNPAYLATLSAMKAVHALLDGDDVGKHLQAAINAAHIRQKFVSSTVAEYAANCPDAASVTSPSPPVRSTY
ncbi:MULTISPECIES: hypothetical protein [unclassified Caballeronia]|uniref:hypothetical protein n=1 Tax=unclassified Caballeronia TaxID=2646786 RepID=UPI0020291683|nr:MULTISPECIES: hypothetical protein [unclassified Caballeronia]